MFGAIEAGGTKMVLAVTDENLAILQTQVIPTEAPDTTFAAIDRFFRDCELAFASPIKAFGVASFGPVDIASGSPTYGQILKTPKPGWEGADFIAALSRFQAPVFVTTDVNGAGLGEHASGAGQGCNTLAYVTVGTGIGAGIIQNGSPLAGVGHYEMGHIGLPRHTLDDYQGCCPFHADCLEGLASGTAIFNRWGMDLASARHSKHAIEIEAHYLAHLACTITLTHAPDRIIMGGGVMKTPGLIEAVREKTASLLNGYITNAALDAGLKRHIVHPDLGDDAGITGAAVLAIRSADL